MAETPFGSSKVERLHGLRSATCGQPVDGVIDCAPRPWGNAYRHRDDNLAMEEEGLAILSKT
jgi:hypothetical protein